jgi:hypothetical protein
MIIGWLIGQGLASKGGERRKRRKTISLFFKFSAVSVPSCSIGPWLAPVDVALSGHEVARACSPM